MKHQELLKLKKWFDNYVAGFYSDDRYVNANLQLKEEHSRRTCAEMLYLAEQLGLDASQTRLAEAIALLHDVGRFEQFIAFRTYHDPRSTDHCLLGVEVLRREKPLDGLKLKEQQIIEKAIEYHGLCELPGGLDDETVFFSKLIRDADKLDVFYVVIENYRKYREKPVDFMLEVELPDEPGYTPEVLQAVLRGELLDYGGLRTLNDMKLLQLGWVYDVNFAATLERIKQRRFLETLTGFLPQTGDIEKVKSKVIGFVDSAIESQGR